MRRPSAARRGQVMILTVLALGGTLLGATTIAGLLTLYQIRNSTDLENSAKAIFAADGGVEWGLYNASCASDGSKAPCPADPLPAFTNGATVKVTCESASGVEVDCGDSKLASIKAVGVFGESSRAFEASF